MGNFLNQNSQAESFQQQHLNLNQPTSAYGSNQIKSTKYTFWTFVPMNILHQFSNLPNMYFLLICILQVIPSISVTGGKPTILIPLSFVIVTVLIKDAYEQFMRYQKDREENRRPILILKDNGFVRDQWENIECGHVIKVLENQLIPCDALILSSNLPDNKCFVQTRSLDGQTNLKPKRGPMSRTKLHKLSPMELHQKNYQIEIGAANPYFNNVNGFIRIQGQQVPISADNVLLRGCNLRNCKQAICVTLYVGSRTKVILNSAKFSGKKSRLMAEIDKMIVGIFIKQLVLSLILSLFNTLLESSRPNFMELLGTSRFVLVTASWWLLMTYFVPISLIVTMQMVKLFQGGILQKDKRGYSTEYNCFISANNTSINENLGQIKYVFTDKTGTLTKNIMNFKKIIVRGLKYGERSDISEAQIASSFPKTTNVKFRDSLFFRNINEENILEVLKIIYLCHDIIVNKEQRGGFSYNSSSPDQIALINFAKLCGYQLMEEQGRFIKIFDRRSNRILKFQKLAFLDFSSDRKRMSVIIRLPNNQIQLLMKGADSMVESRLGPNQPSLQNTKRFLEQFSIEGLRTLMLAKRKLPESEFNQWFDLYTRAKSSIQDRQKKLQEVYQKIEVNMSLVGGTAVEDQLQDEVSETIVMMKQAGIKFFILTGDKKQTAVSIGRACGLISPTARIFSYPQQKRQGQAFKSQKVYLLNAQKQIAQYPADIYNNQTICYRCTPVQKKNIVNYIKQHSSDLTLAIGDGANDVNMILAADVGVGVKGRQGTQATRVADIAVGQYKFLSFITLYYGRQWYRKNATLISFSFFKNWYHVSCVITYGAYSYYSAMVIFDIYNYELFNALYTALPILIYAVFDEQYDWNQSKSYNDIYRPGLTNSYFNNIVYFKSIGRGIIYGVVSILMIFMVLEDNIIAQDGRVGYMWQSGSVLLYNIIMIVNFRVIVLSNRFSIGLLISVFGSLILYWFVYWMQTKMFEDFKLRDSIHQQWTTIPIYFIHFILIFVLLISQYAYRKFLRLKDKQNRLLMYNVMGKVVKNFINFQGMIPMVPAK